MNRPPASTLAPARRLRFLRRRGAVRTLVAWAVGVACVVPFVYLAFLSLVEAWAPLVLLPGALGMGRWRSLLGGGGGLGASLALSLALSTVVAAISTAVGFAAARLPAYGRRRGLWRVLAYGPFAVSPVLLGVCLMPLVLRAGLAGTPTGVVLAQLTGTTGFAVVFFSAFWSERVAALEALARTLGARPWDVFRRVVWPLARPLVGIGFVQAFLLSWVQYGLTSLVGMGRVQTLPVRVFNYLNEASPYHAAVAACLLVAPPLVLLALNARLVFGSVGGVGADDRVS